jgi:hypothetical protein
LSALSAEVFDSGTNSSAVVCRLPGDEKVALGVLRRKVGRASLCYPA